MVLENFFTREELETFREETERLVDDIARKLFDARKISSKITVLPFISFFLLSMPNAVLTYIVKSYFVTMSWQTSLWFRVPLT